MTKLKDLKWFCPQPFTNYVLYRDLAPSSCCVLKEWPRNKIKRKYKTNDPRKLHNKAEYADFRKEFLNGGGPLIKKHCQVCIEQEKHSGESHRKVYLEKFIGEYGEYNQYLEDLENYIDTDMTEPHILTMEYVAPNNFCNLRCNMCGPGNSSSLAKENIDIGLTNIFQMEKYKNNPLQKIKDNVEKYDDILINLAELKLVGGETLAIKNNYDMMQRTIDLGVSKNIVLKITTNGTLTPKFDGKDIFHYIPYFRRCSMTVSIEFWGERNNYLRFPSKWDVIINNAKRFVECPNTNVTFAATVNALNIGYMPEISCGVKELMSECDEPSVNLKETFSFPKWSWASGSLVWGEGNEYAVTALPLDIREQYMEKYFDFGSKIIEDHNNFQKLYAYMEEMPFDEKLHKEMMTNVQLRDKHRGTCLVDVFPEWEPYYEKL